MTFMSACSVKAGCSRSYCRHARENQATGRAGVVMVRVAKPLVVSTAVLRMLTTKIVAKPDKNKSRDMFYVGHQQTL